MIAIGSDHAGYTYKDELKPLLKSLGQECQDFGTNGTASVDYPDVAAAVADAVRSGACDTGILICGTGIGMSIAANKHEGIRAAVCESVTAARLARAHNHANVLCLGSRITGWEAIVDIVRTFLATPFDSGERHQRRVDKLNRPLRP